MIMMMMMMSNIMNADADDGSMTPSRNDRRYTLRSVQSSPGLSFLFIQNHLHDHHQIGAALEFSVPSIPSLVSEKLGAPLYLGGYKVFILFNALSLEKVVKHIIFPSNLSIKYLNLG